MAARLRRALARGVALLLALPLLATLLATFAVLVPVERVRSAVAEAFATGELGDDDYRWRDTRRGIDQLTDCLVLQSALYRSSDPLRSALGASIFEPPPGTSNCSLLHQEILQPGSGTFVPYYRYWHGNKSLELLLLATGLSIQGLRWLLHIGTYLAIGVFALAGLQRSRGAGLPRVVVALFGACFSAVPFMGQLLSHAPGYIFVWLAAAWLVVREVSWAPSRLSHAAFAVGFAAPSSTCWPACPSWRYCPWSPSALPVRQKARRRRSHAGCLPCAWGWAVAAGAVRWGRTRGATPAPAPALAES